MGVDWTTQQRVTAVKNQGHCGSCWAFSTTGGTEGAWSGATGNLLSLSEQQLVDCSKANNGCGGGLMDAGFAYQETVNVASESSYAYTAKDGSCKTSFTTAIPKGGVTGSKDVSGETDLQDFRIDGEDCAHSSKCNETNGKGRYCQFCW